MTSELRALAIGDVGRSAGYHVGDDAMMAGLLAAAKPAGIDLQLSIVAAEPAVAGRRFGVAALPLVGFDRVGDAAGRADLLVSGRLPTETAEALASSDALIVAGGGNISRSWPALVYERLALARAARRRGLPVLISGQSLGPWFGPEVAPLARELLAGAVLVGVRESSSYWLAEQLGVPRDRLVLTGDDAAALSPQPPAGAPAHPFVAVTLNDVGPERIEAFGRQLAVFGRQTGARLVLVPHVGDLDAEPADDVAVAHRLAELVPAEVAALPSVTEAVWYCRQAELVLSSRYHPVVFAAAQGRPALFIGQDSYTTMKGGGALEQAGLAGWQLPIDRVDRLAEAAAELWHRRAEIAGYLGRWAGRRADHLPAMLRTLAGATSPVPAAIIGPAGPQPEGSWATRAPSLAELFDAEATGWLAGSTESSEAARHYAESLVERAETAERYAASLLTRAEVAERYAASLAERAQTAERYAASLQQPPGGGAG